MDLGSAPSSGNVEDRRGMGTGLALGGGGGLLMLILGLIFGPQIGNFAGGQRASGPGDAKTLEFSKKVLGTTEVVWDDQFRKMGKTYRPPKMVLFTDKVRSGCGVAPAAVGPFYCPADQKLYLDPTFFDELEKKLGGSKAEFSQAYVVAHEVGHHVQNLLGYSARVDAKRGTRDENDASVRLELQADYLAGVWAHHGQKKFNFIQPGDVEAAIKSANAIGDDRLQKRGGGFVHPEKFTHGTSEQRVKWFKRGLETGRADKAALDYFFTVPNSRDL